MSLTPPTSDSAPLLAPEPVPQLLRDLIHERTGIFFDPDRFDTLLEKLLPRARAHGCVSYLDYYYILKYEEKGPDEWRRVMDAFSVQETYFWRELDQVQALVKHVVPRWFREHSTPLRIWSAACATGEEPYSLAIALHEAGMGAMPIEIYGSDGSETALQKARAGVYRERSFRALPLALRSKYFTASPQGDKIDASLASKVTFRRANLMDAAEIHDLASAGVIFCRNVFIYFSPSAIGRVISVFADRMPSNSHLFVGASESLLKLTSDFELTEVGGAFVYVRKERPAPR